MVHTFHIDDSNSKAKALMEFLRTLEFVKEEKSDWGEEVSEELESSILRGLKESIQEVKLAKQGKIKLKSAKDLLDEL